MKKKVKCVLALALVVCMLNGCVDGAPPASPVETPQSTETPDDTDTEGVETEETGEAEEGNAEEAPDGDPLPIPYVDVDMETADGEIVYLSDYVDTDCLVVNFWASWCGPCIAELPRIAEVMEEYKDKNVTFLMVNICDGQNETKEIAQEYLEKNNLKFDNLVFDTIGTISGTYAVTSIPSTLFINRNGDMYGGYRGAVTKKQLKDAIDEALNME